MFRFQQLCVENFNVIHNVFTEIGSRGVIYRSRNGNAASTGIITNNIFYNMNGEEFGADAEDIEENNMLKSQNPMFVNPNSPLGPDGIPFTNDDGFRLQSSSPARNSGINVGVTTDILGNSRDSSPDMGAYEY